MLHGVVERDGGDLRVAVDALFVHEAAAVLVDPNEGGNLGGELGGGLDAGDLNPERGGDVGHVHRGARLSDSLHAFLGTAFRHITKFWKLHPAALRLLTMRIRHS